MLKIKNDENITKRTSATNIEKDKKNNQQAMITEAAYYMAEKRGFEGGHEVEDWLAAEKQIMKNTV